MFIIEGADHLGKTTAAKRIIKLIEDKHPHRKFMEPPYYSHMSRPGPGFNFWSHYKDRMSVYGIQDRFHLGALAWHQDCMDEPRLRYVEGQLLTRASFVVLFVNGNSDWYDERLKCHAKTEMFSEDKIHEGNLAYIEMMSGRGDMPRVYYDDVVWVNNDEMYPSDDLLNNWIERWWNRLSYYEQEARGNA